MQQSGAFERTRVPPAYGLFCDRHTTYGVPLFLRETAYVSPGLTWSPPPVRSTLIHDGGFDSVE